MIDFILNI